MIPPEKSGLLAISQSGETKDTHRAVMLAADMQMPSFSIINQVGSLIARTTNCGIYTNSGREVAVASTKAFTSQVTVLALMASWFAQKREEETGTHQSTQRRRSLVDAIHRLPTYAGMTLSEQNHKACKKIAQTLEHQHQMFILGKGFAEPIAQEAALKIKEIGYLNAQGYSGGALKHGPFALLNKGTPVLHYIFDDEHAPLMRIAAQETKTRGCMNIVITDLPKLAEGIADHVVVVPSNGPLTALLGVIPAQMIAYELATLKKITVDTPQNLAKSVTVD